MIYDKKEVFSLHDEDLVYCDWLKHTIPAIKDRSVYLLHHTIPRHLQGEVCKCLDSWMFQGIIQPSKSPYASQGVLVHRKLGEIYICVDYQKLNFIMVRDTFPFCQIDKALQAVHSSNQFSSFDCPQGYVQEAMEEDDMKKTAFRARSSDLYEFIHMPFGLSVEGSSLCHIMEHCLGNQ